MRSQSGPLDPESLTELALHGAGDRPEQVLDEAALAQLEDLTLFVAACRDASSLEAYEGSVADRALSAAKTEDLSWRGDLRLLKGFVGDGLRSSALLRLAAASLLLHVAALPVVAFFVLSEEPAIPEFRVEVGRRELPYAAQDPDKEDANSALEVDAHEGLETLLVENTLRWSRWVLSETVDPREGSNLSSPPWMDQRAEILWGSGAANLPDTSSVFVATESALDLFLVREGPAAASSSFRELLGPLTASVGASGDPRTWLALSSLARAESYGLLDEENAKVLRAARDSMPIDHHFRRLIEVEGDLRRRFPLDPLWVEAFSQLSADEASADWAEALRQFSELGDR